MLPSAPATADETQVSRYSTLPLAPSEIDLDPLAVVARVTFPRPVVNTVGDAVDYLLLRTGYRLAEDASSRDPVVAALFKRPLPESHRVLGPYRVSAMLRVLMGRRFELVVDEATRTLSYRLLAAVVSAPDTTKAEADTAVLPVTKR